MPPVRTLQAHQFRFSPTSKQGSVRLKAQVTTHAAPVAVATDREVMDLAICDVIYPLKDSTRLAFRTKAGKAPTAHQWAVYDFVRNIPVGKVTTYKDICVALGQGSPRSVGAALRHNPFAPFVPCHRIIASNHFIGGFYGEWGQDGGTGKQCNRKIEMLAKEGVGFTEKGYLVGGDAMVWKG